MKKTKKKSKSPVSKRPSRVSSKRALLHKRDHRGKKTARHHIRINRSWPSKFLLHPASIFFLLCVGVLICGLTYKVLADTVISSVIEAPPLATAATITSPTNEQSISNLPIYVVGGCPTDSYVELELNGSFDGVAWCAEDNTYSMETYLYQGTNKLSVQDYNSTDEAGPSTSAIEVYYQPTTVTADHPSTSQQAKVTGSATSTIPASLLLTSDFKFTTFLVSKSFSWQIDIAGDVPPYRVNVGWGDGKYSNYVYKTDPLVNLQHKYVVPGYYSVTIKVTGSSGQTRFLELAALITNANGKAPFISATSSSNTEKTSLTGLLDKTAAHWLTVAWPAYIIVVLMTLSFWLGERRELKIIHRFGRK